MRAQISRMSNRSYNGNGRRDNFLPVIIASIAIVISLLQGFWSFADPRGTLSKLETKFDQYVTVREYEENKKNTARTREALTRDVDRITEIQRDRAATIERVRSLEKQMDSFKGEFEELIRVLGSGNSIGDRLKYIQDELSRLRDKILIPPKDIVKP